MKYLQKSFSVGASREYAAAYEATFGKKERRCAWCDGTGLVPDPAGLMAPCPKGCEAHV